MPGTLLLGWGHRPCHTGVLLSPCTASQCRDATTSLGPARDSGKPLRHNRIGTDLDHGGHSCPERLQCPGSCHCPFAESHTAHTEACTPRDAIVPWLEPLSLCWT